MINWHDKYSWLDVEKMLMTRKRDFHYFLNQNKCFTIPNLIKEGLKSGPALLKICIIMLCIMSKSTHVVRVITFHWQHRDRDMWTTIFSGAVCQCYEHDVAWVFITPSLMRFHSLFTIEFLLLFRLDYWNISCYNACVHRRFQLGTPRQRKVCPIKNSFFGRQAFLRRYIRVTQCKNSFTTAGCTPASLKKRFRLSSRSSPRIGKHSNEPRERAVFVPRHK